MSKYENLSREQLVNLLTKRDAQRKLEIEADRALNSDFVVMTPDPKVSHRAPSENLMIEGDNFDALRWLRMTMRGQVRVILIDPPYNRGKKDLVYNDRYIREDDRLKDSLWLDWLYQRLTIARDLLTEDGVMLICIDDAKRAILDLMMDQVMPGQRLGSIVWRSRSGGNDGGGGFMSVDHEHILVYAMPEFRFGGREKSFAMYDNPDNDPRGDWRTSDMTVSVAFDDKRAGNGYYPIRNPETGIWYPCNPDSVWRYASRDRLKPGQRLKTKTMEEFIEDGKVIFPRNDRVQVWDTMEALLADIDAGNVPTTGNGVPLLRRDLPELELWIGRKVGWGIPQFKRHKRDLKFSNQPLSSWVTPQSEIKGEKAKSATENAERVEIVGTFTQEETQALKGLFGEAVFDYPKPPTIIRELLRQATSETDIILDFFAGSGTTAQAVLELNAEDEGSRRFIMVSNTEATEKEPDKNICRDVCAERLRLAINGTAKVEGIPGSFVYLKAEKIAFADLSYDLLREQIWTAIQVMHGVPVSLTPGHADFETAQVSYSSTVFYVDRWSDASEAAVRAALERGSVLVYCWTAGVIQEAIQSPRLEARSVVDELIRRFQS